MILTAVFIFVDHHYFFFQSVVYVWENFGDIAEKSTQLQNLKPAEK